ncbi:DNA polymerase Y family protein [Azospirillum sp.]|uniref:Y-family DNA polymerase n=1 Tax=Azospirillum sp. TaxID=34012 RepID=UPI003D743EA0
MARRILSLWLPRLATDAWARRRPETAAQPLASVAAERGRLIVAATNRAAERAGVHPGATLADARAVEPGLATFDADPAADAALLDRLAGWALRWTPWTAADGDGLVLDVTGCAHLFGGESGLARDVVERLARTGFESRAAIADTPAAAWAVARYATLSPLGRGWSAGPGEGGPRRAASGNRGTSSPQPSPQRGEGVIIPPLAQRQALDPLPMAALRLPAGIVAALDAVGLRRIGDLHGVPRATLAARFGAEPMRRLDQALGQLDEPVSPHRPVVPHSARLAFAEPISTPDDLARAARHLLDTLCAGLERSQEGARRLELEAHRIDRRPEDAPQTLAIGTGRPVRDPAALMRLFAEKLERIEPGPGIEVMVLAAPVVGPLGALQTGLDGGSDDSGLGELVDRLGNRLGPRSVLRLVPRASWLPERAVAGCPALGVPANQSAPLLWPADRPRPVRLLAPPEPIEAVAPVPDDPPRMFRWRGVAHRVRRADGPERIESEWWRKHGDPRDYYRVEDSEGRRFWLFRQGLYRPDAAARWFLHGFFG